MSEAHKGKPRPYLRKCPKQRLLEGSDRGTGPDSCWVWKGAKFGNTGYGQIQYQGKPTRTHRLSYQVFVGDIPDGLLVLHRCDVRVCINPSHLFLGTHKQNMDDMRSKGRENFAKGERIGAAKMTEEKVREARRLWKSGKYTKSSLCRRYGLTRVPMDCLLTGKTWKHVTE